MFSSVQIFVNPINIFRFDVYSQFVFVAVISSRPHSLHTREIERGGSYPGPSAYCSFQPVLVVVNPTVHRREIYGSVETARWNPPEESKRGGRGVKENGKDVKGPDGIDDDAEGAADEPRTLDAPDVLYGLPPLFSWRTKAGAFVTYINTNTYYGGVVCWNIKRFITRALFTSARGRVRVKRLKVPGIDTRRYGHDPAGTTN